MTADAAKALIRALPGVEEGASYGKPAFKLRGKYFTHLRDDDAVLVLPMTIADREVWLDLAPETY
ncbi:MAG: MmcQ/YjbR family DNA-binding protein, partial [Gammaproteobacteria bacterium]|nr:MmcQ/YjbR family DNA-binding protein [Gammaproteobacteria bacterium]